MKFVRLCVALVSLLGCKNNEDSGPAYDPNAQRAKEKATIEQQLMAPERRGPGFAIKPEPLPAQEAAPGPVETLTGGGATTAGRSTSLTVMVRLQLGPAVVELVAMVLPTGKNEPEGGLFVTTPQLPLETAAS